MPKTKKTPPNPAPVPPVPQKVTVTDLGVLEALSAITVEVVVADKTFVFEGRRLRPVESKEVKLLLEQALPPVLPPKEDDKEPRYDFTDPAYLRKNEENQRKARSVALWAAFPVFQSKWRASAPEGAGAEKLGGEEIQKFIEGLSLDEEVLDTLFRALTQRTVTAAYVGFTSGNSSRKS